MKCLNCGHDRWHTLEGRRNIKANAFRRRKRCDACGSIYTTYERIATAGQVNLAKRQRGVDCCGARTILKGIRKQLEEALHDETEEKEGD